MVPAELEDGGGEPLLRTEAVEAEVGGVVVEERVDGQDVRVQILSSILPQPGQSRSGQIRGQKGDILYWRGRRRRRGKEIKQAGAELW